MNLAILWPGDGREVDAVRARWEKGAWSDEVRGHDWVLRAQDEGVGVEYARG